MPEYYNVRLRGDLYAKLQEIATLKGTTVDTIVRKGITLLLVIQALQDKEGARLIVQDGDTERELDL